MSIRTFVVVICVILIAALFVIAMAAFASGNIVQGVIFLGSTGLLALLGSHVSQ